MDNDIDIELLIYEVQKRPIIWDKTLEEKKDRVATGNAWRDVFSALNPDFETMPKQEQKKFEKEIHIKWKTVRDGYRRALQRVAIARRSGTAGIKIKKYIYNDELGFLEKLYANDDMGAVEDRYLDKMDNDRWEAPPQNTSGYSEATRLTTNKLRKEKFRCERKIEESRSIIKTGDPPNRHMSFFQGLLPSLENFNDDQVIEFQIGVLGLIKQVKDEKKQAPPSNLYDHTIQGQQFATDSNNLNAEKKQAPSSNVYEHSIQSQPFTSDNGNLNAQRFSTHPFCPPHPPTGHSISNPHTR